MNSSRRNIASLAVFLMLFVYVSEAFGLAPIGPITSLKKGQFSASIDYAYGNMDLRAKGISTLSQYSGGTPFNTHSVSKSIKLKGLNTHEVYGNLRYGVTDKLNAFLRVGAANTNWRDNRLYQSTFPTMSIPNWGDNSQPQFAIGFGTQVTVYDKKDWKLGFLSQFSWTKSHYDSVVLTTWHWVSLGPGPDTSQFGGHVTKEMSGKLSLKEMQFAIGITHKLRNQSLIYGGPFLHILDGDLNLNSDFGPPNGSIVRVSYDINRLVELGGYIGTQIVLAKNTSMNIEYQHTSTADVLGLSLIHRK